MTWISSAQSSPRWLVRYMLTEPRRPAAIRESRRAHSYVVATVCVGAFMGQLNASIVTLALPSLGRDLNAGAGAVEWVAGWCSGGCCCRAAALGGRSRARTGWVPSCSHSPPRVCFCFSRSPHALATPALRRWRRSPEDRWRSGSCGAERAAPAPLIDLSILRRPALGTGLGGGLISYLVLFGTLYVVPYYLSARHVPAASIGVQLAVPPVALGIAAPIGGRLLGRVGAGLLTVGGVTLAAAGAFEIALRHGTVGLLVGLMLTGLGLGAFIPANNATIMSASPPGHVGVVSGILSMTRGIGTALGVAVAGAVYAAAGASYGLAVTLAVLGAFALATSQALRLGSDS